MKPGLELDEAAMTALEAHIPLLAEGALRKAYLQALTLDGRVLEAVDGQLVATSADGAREILRPLDSKPFRVPAGARRVRKLPS